jgi:hypothetical protein
MNSFPLLISITGTFLIVLSVLLVCEIEMAKSVRSFFHMVPRLVIGLF